MANSTLANRLGRMPIGFGGIIVTLCLISGCDRTNDHQVQGYVEGEFVYIASPLAGSLEALHVQRGAQVAAGDPLFALGRHSGKSGQR